MLDIEASRAARASAICRAVSGECGRVGEADVEALEAWLLFVSVDGGREGERDGALVDVEAEAEAEAEFDITAVGHEVYKQLMVGVIQLVKFAEARVVGES
jgi:hypothetical protein